jgi:hypothetical protein
MKGWGVIVLGNLDGLVDPQQISPRRHGDYH